MIKPQIDIILGTVSKYNSKFFAFNSFQVSLLYVQINRNFHIHLPWLCFPPCTESYFFPIILIPVSSFNVQKLLLPFPFLQHF